jgi:hypothetical protein
MPFGAAFGGDGCDSDHGGVAPFLGCAYGIVLHNNPTYIIPQRKGIVKWENGDSLYFVEK